MKLARQQIRRALGSPVVSLKPCLLGSVIASLLALSFAFAQTAHAHGELDLRIADVTRQIKATTNASAQLYLQRGELHREHRDWPAAEADYARAAQLDPSLTTVDLCRAHLLAESGQLEAARAMFGKVLARSPNEGVAFVGRARTLVRLHQPQAAIADYNQGLELLAEPAPEFFVELAQVLAAQDQRDEALQSLDRGIKKLG